MSSDKLNLYNLVSKMNLTKKCKLKSVQGLTVLLGFEPVHIYENRIIRSRYEYRGLVRDGKTPLKFPGKFERISNKMGYQFYIKKKNGKKRKIVSYGPYMSNIFLALKEVLEPMLQKFIMPEFVGSVPEVSLPETGRAMSLAMGQRAVLGLTDVVQWFDNIKLPHVQKVLDLVLEDYIGTCGKVVNTSEVISIVLTYMGRLPQGNPCSSMIANVVGSVTWGPEIKKYCDANGISWWAYVDNIVLIKDCSQSDMHHHLGVIKQIVRTFGFKLHKTRIIPPYRRQQVLGMVLNKPFSPRVPIETKKQINTIIHKAKCKKRDGEDLFLVIREWVEKYGGKRMIRESLEGEELDFTKIKHRVLAKIKFQQWITGKVNWVDQLGFDKGFKDKNLPVISELFELISYSE